MKKVLVALTLVAALLLTPFAMAEAPELEAAEAAMDEAVVEIEDLLIDDVDLPDEITASDALEVEDLEPVAEDIAPAAIEGNRYILDDVFEVEDGILVTYYGNAENVVIPSGITGIREFVFNQKEMRSVYIPDSVTSIGTCAFQSCIYLTSVSIPNSVTYIGESAFRACTNLMNVSLSNAITTIEEGTFAYCPRLSKITIPDGVTRIGVSAFDHCKSLASISIPDSVTSIGRCAFEECSDLTGISIPNRVTRIEDRAFKNCVRLNSIAIPNSVLNIGAWTFEGCADLTSVTLPNNIATIENNTFEDCKSLTDIVIPSSVLSIGDSAFRSCTSLSAVTIPDRVTSIGSSTFIYCTGLKDVTFTNGNVTMGFAPFDGCPASMTVHVPCNTPVAQYIAQQGFILDLIHTPVTDPAVAPTYDKTGLTEGKHCLDCGTVLEAQKIVPKLPKTSLAKCKITVKDKVYTGKALKPAVTVKLGSVKLKQGTDYTVTYKNNTNVSTATVVVKGKGKYTGTAKATFAINPKKLAVSKLTAGKQQLTVKWKKQDGVTGYEIEYSLNKSFKNSKTIKATKTKTAATIKKLTGGKKYYVRIRAYKVVKKKTYYSAWSAAKNVKVKK